MTNVQKSQPGTGKESIHSGHFMVSHFEADAQDEFDDLAVPVPDEEQNTLKVNVITTYTVAGALTPYVRSDKVQQQQQVPQLSIENSLTKLFKCMTLAYRQKLTSPKWNRFKGIKLRWKDKIRLNNVIWRCWHMQFIKKQNTLVCQFASPLDVDTHVKPETTILEGKYWKRRAEAVTAEYKKWRMFHIMRLFGKGDNSVQDSISEMDTVESFSQCSDLAETMLTDEDYLNFMSDTLFSTITNHQPFAFPDPREIARGANLADFIQPSLGPLQPNLDDFMDTMEPLHDLLTPRLPPVPEETALTAEEPMYRGTMSVGAFPAQGFISAPQPNTVMSTNQMAIHVSGTTNSAQMMSQMPDQSVKNEHLQMYDNRQLYAQDMQGNLMTQEVPPNYTHNVQTSDQVQSNIFNVKSTRLQYVSAPKIVQADNTTNYKYSGAIPPSQTAPETVSLLQQPIQNPKYASTIVMQGRSAYERTKSRPRIAHYQNQVPNNQYQNYANVPQQSITYDSRQVAPRQTSPQMQYLQPSVSKTAVNNRTFKMPSPPLAPVTQQVQPSSRINPPVKESYRSSSLPVGAQLNADWTISTPVPEPVIASHTHRGRSSSPGAIRLRSRSSSSSALGGSGSGSSGEVRRPPPLHSAASEPALPHTSVMLAHLLAAQNSQSVYKLNSSTEDGISELTPSSMRRGQPSPGSDIVTNQGCASPPSSPQSPSGEPRRAHMHAEQKRRCNIKNGFDTLQALIPHLNNNPAAKISKAAMLQKGADYIKQLKAERNQIKEEMESLRQQIECLNNSISNCHSLLPATGAPVSRARAGRLREMFGRHVANRTMHNWKYWLFSVVAATLVDSFSSCVSCSSAADLVRTTLLWAEQHCSLVEMRPAVLNSLRVLCTTTDILTNPERLPEEARAAIATGSAVKTEPT